MSHPLDSLVILAVAGLATGCACAPTSLEDKGSPGGEFLAAVYTDECGPTAPNVLRVAVRRSASPTNTDVVRLVDTPLSAHVEWISANRLRVMFDCPDRKDCAGSARWSVWKASKAGDVAVEYALSARLEAALDGGARKRLLR